jgi:RimJ/RimL family protein N-acetyltransferase
LHAGVTVADVGAWIASQPQLRADGTAYNFAIVDARDDAFIGGCGLTQINYGHRFANLYYWVRSSRAGQGAASAATLLLARFGFSSLGLQRIEIVIATGNHASKRVAEKVGAKYEGLLRNRLNMHGVSYDAYMFSLVPGDL